MFDEEEQVFFFEAFDRICTYVCKAVLKFSQSNFSIKSVVILSNGRIMSLLVYLAKGTHRK